ncbi:MAG TPA: ABC transporter ATP-binding protein [Cyanobacteria bacterium UBA8803]|nr:ABC transporter ATP-binding protein [Cyanobacteria bacterium UBA9273]HBL62827.1 ABC transporter ATP-binding protein [Cyanobacteria bacterium UBA8803]
MSSYLSKFLYVLPTNKSRLLPLLLVFLFAPVLDTLGIGLIGAFTGLATNPESIYHMAFLSDIYHKSGLKSIKLFITLLGLVIMVVFYIKSALFLQIQRYIYRFSYGQQRKLRLKLMKTYLSAPYTFHIQANTADLIHNVFNETNIFCNKIMLPSLQGLSEFAVIIFLVLLLAKTDLVATATVSSLLLMAFLIYNQFRGRLAHLGKEASKAQAEALRILNHALGGFKEMRVIGCEGYFENQMDEQAKRYTKAGSTYQVFQIIPRLLIEVILITFLIGFTSIFIIIHTNTQNFTSVLSIFAVASIRLIPSVSKFMSALGDLRNSSYALDKLYLDVKEIENLKSTQRKEPLPHSSTEPPFSSQITNSQAMPFVNQVVLDKLTYRYPNAPEPALKEVSLTLPRGHSIAFIGKSGAGKTTLVDVILGLLTPESGDITVDGLSVYTNLRSWQNLVGYIPQSIFLIDDTLERNIAYGVPDPLIDLNRLNNAINAAQLEDLVEQLPNGIKTTVGERGVRLSGGQRQRVGIARALYHQREILVMDEATAALDAETETLVTEAIKSLSGTKTIIIIAHRLSTVKHCDCIYLIDRGSIAKSGSYQEVVGD